MKIVHLRTNHMNNPLGYDLGKPVVSWKVEETKGKFTQNAVVQAATDPNFQNIVYEISGKNLDSYGTVLDIPMEPSVRYYWKVKITTDKDEEAVSSTAWFETPKNPHVWKGIWISPDFQKNSKEDGIVFHEFNISKTVKKARLSISGLGLYEVYIDGKKVGDEYLTPNFNDYFSWIQFQTYEAEEYLCPGTHKIEIWLGSGWYKGKHLTFNEGNPDCHYGDTSGTIAELKVFYEDGTEELFQTDLTWKGRRSCIRANSLYDGEIIDETFNQSEIFSVKELNIGTEQLKARLSLPVRKKLIKKPKELILTPKGERVLDFGQNMAGWIVFYNRLDKGQTCKMTGGEILQQGNFYHENMRSAKTEFTYTSDGESKWIRPHFTYYGFRYIKLEGFPENIKLEDFEAWVLYSDMEETGSIITGNEKVNQLISNILWSQRSNFIDVPTDCPQRDERLGWTGDTQVFCKTASFNMDTQEFYRKHMYDVWSEQKKNNGMVPMVVPDLFLTATSAAWGDIAVIVPWVQYQMYGDRSLLKKQFSGMKAWVEYIYKMGKEEGETGLWKAGTHFGDWLSLDTLDGRATGGTDVHFIASAYYYYSVSLLVNAAEVLNLCKDSEKYSKLKQKIRASFIKEYYTGTGRLAVDTQTAYILVLYLHLYPEGKEKNLILRLVDKIKENKNHLTTGFVGTPLLCPVLSQYGYGDLAYTLLLNEDFPGWLYAVNMGATTIWERWNSVRPDGTMHPDGMNSLNHYAYGSIQEWMYQYMLGIQEEKNVPAWKSFILRPQPDQRIGKAEAVFDSPFGKIVSAWEYKESNIFFHFEIPFDTSAKILLPDGQEKTVTAGSYDYVTKKEALPAKEPGDRYLEDLLNDTEISVLLQQRIPAITKHKDDTYKGKTLRESMNEVFNRYTLLDLKKLEEEIKCLSLSKQIV